MPLAPKKPPTVDPTKPAEIKTPITPDCQLWGIRFSPCGRLLAAAGYDGTVRRWDVTGEAPVELPRLPGHNGWVTSIVFHSDRKRLFSADSWGRILAWDYTSTTPKKLWEIPTAHDGWVRKLALSPDGRTLAACGRDGTVRLWDTAKETKQKELAIGDDALSLAYHPGGALLVGTLHGHIQQWDTAAAKITRTLEVPEYFLLHRIQEVGGVRCFAFDSVGKSLYCGGAIPKTGGFVQGTPYLVAFDWAGGKRTSEWKGADDTEGFIHDLRTDAKGNVLGVTSGQPGKGHVFFWKPGEKQPYFDVKKPNCHSLDLHPQEKTLAVSTTNANSSGNGRVKGKGGEEYPANYSPIILWTMPTGVAS